VHLLQDLVHGEEAAVEDVELGGRVGVLELVDEAEGLDGLSLG